MYKCSRCKEPVRSGMNTVGLQCEKCGSKVFYKERPNVRKTVHGR
jgi:DNA-directed RNA polymerase subunit P